MNKKYKKYIIKVFEMFTGRNTILKKTKSHDLNREQYLFQLLQDYETYSNQEDSNNQEINGKT